MRFLTIKARPQLEFVFPQSVRSAYSAARLVLIKNANPILLSICVSVSEGVHLIKTNIGVCCDVLSSYLLTKSSQIRRSGCLLVSAVNTNRVLQQCRWLLWVKHVYLFSSSVYYARHDWDVDSEICGVIFPVAVSSHRWQMGCFFEQEMVCWASSNVCYCCRFITHENPTGWVTDVWNTILGTALYFFVEIMA